MPPIPPLPNRNRPPQSNSQMEETDAAALARAKAGDRDGFRLLVERHSRGVFRLAYRLTGNEQDAEDVVQESFLRAYKQLRHFESRASFGTWLYRIAANYSLDLIRLRKRRQDRQPPRDPESEPDAVLQVPSSDPAPDRIAYSVQLSERIEVALAALTEQERAAFVMRHFEGFSIEEIGAALGLGISAAKHSIFRAVQKLRKALEPAVSSI
jgi:RNA polymerase sigma-70 factor (ECF subfamily)